MTNPDAPGRIRPVGAFELEVLADLHATCFAEAWDEAAMATLLAMPGAFALIGAGAGPTDALIPAGFVMVRAIAGEAEILALGVRPSGRGHGLGRRLLAAAAAEAASRGAARLFLEVAADNLAARALYLAEGFTQIGRRPNYYHRPDAGIAALVLAKELAIDGNDRSKIEKKP